ncbi:MAG TPA: magnesium transporter [Candidatus Saccharimonadales bacterium]|nr:magnesium transporter [Candidatus Saccharimonadales bacterium]
MSQAIAPGPLLRQLKSPPTRMAAFRQIPPNEQGFVLLRLSKKIQTAILKTLDAEEIIRFIRYLGPNDTTDLLQNIESRKGQRIIAALGADIKTKVEFLLKFHPQTAAGMMSLDYIEVEQDARFSEAANFVQKHEKQTGKFPSILVVRSGILAGELPGHAFALSKGSDKIAPHVKPVPHITYNAEEKDVQALFQKSAHSKIIVLDEDDSIMGVIYADDILRLLHKRQNRELYNFAGVQEEEDALDSAATKVRYRYKWLIINLATAFLAASVVGLFEATISKFVLLAVYMPIVAGMGGNAGTQAMAVAVRGLALREVELGRSRHLISNEVIAGGVNGLINGLIVALIATLWNQSPLLGLVLGVAMVVNLIIAGFFGALIPLVMQRMKKDPASSATIFITTATDVFGFFVFLGLASIIL